MKAPNQHVSADWVPNDLKVSFNTHPSYDHHGGGRLCELLYLVPSRSPFLHLLVLLVPFPLLLLALLLVPLLLLALLAPPACSQLTPSSPTALPHLPAVKHLKGKT